MNFAKSRASWQLASRNHWLTAPIMVQFATLMTCLAMVFTAWEANPAWGQLVTQSRAAQVGLERAWFTQIDLDPTRNRVANWLLHDDLLFAVTTAGTVHALDITTGKTAWSVQVGHPKYPTLGPAANRQYVAVIHGSKLMLLDRDNGRLKWVRDTGAAPSSGPALSEDRVFVALINGRVEAFSLNNTKRMPWYYQSVGRAYYKPVATTKSICWATDLGTLYVGRLKPLSLSFRLETAGEIVAPPTEMAPYLMVGSTDGNLYCVHELSGVEHWRYSTGDPITHAPAVVGERVFITSHAPALHALDTATGQRHWTTAGVAQFVALGKEHVYGIDRYGNLLVLDAKTGGVVGRLTQGRRQSSNGLSPWNKLSPGSEGGSWNERGPALINDQNDRIFLVSDTGLVQCLHEIGVSDPIYYRQPVGEPGEDTDSAAAKTKNGTEETGEQDTQVPAEVSQPLDSSGVNKDQDSITPPESAPVDENPFDVDGSNPFGE